MLDVIFNADDFGISQGVNDAIFKAHTEGILNSTSLMINQDFAADAVQKAKQMPDLKIGLHINLTNQKPASNPDEIPLLVDKDGNFKNGFVNLFILSFFETSLFALLIAVTILLRSKSTVSPFLFITFIILFSSLFLIYT